jgi:hypothetical protein
MDAKHYCSTVNTELTALKARAYDIMRQVDKMENKEKLFPQFSELHGLVDDLNVAINKLSAECPADYSAAKNDIQAKKDALWAKIDWWDKDHIAGGYVGG